MGVVDDVARRGVVASSSDAPARPVLRVLDLFAGIQGWSAAFKKRGHEVVTVDLEPSFGCTLTADVLQLEPREVPGPWDIVLASPPCEAFSVMTIGKNWDGRVPKTEGAQLAIRLVRKTVDLIDALEPRAFVIENPRGMMRNLPFLGRFERRTVTYCQFGKHYQKPTDLWGGFPPTLRLAPPCSTGDPCHEPVPRGAHSGIQAVGIERGFKGAAPIRAEVPYALSLRVCLAMENWPTGARRLAQTRLARGESS